MRNLTTVAGIHLLLTLAGFVTAAEVQLQYREGEVSCPGLKLGKSLDKPFVLDHRFQPPYWQTSICLPDDWQKTLVGKDGAMLYDYPGEFAQFGTRITVGLDGEPVTWTEQRLDDPRVPIVITTAKQGSLELTTQAFAVTDPVAWPSAPTQEFAKLNSGRGIERLGQFAPNLGWARPKAPAGAVFADIDVGFGTSLRYRFKAEAGRDYCVVFGLCEGYWNKPGKRVLELRVEGRIRNQVDPIADHGQNAAFAKAVDAKDLNGDGWLDIEVSAAAVASDKNTILNALWVFEQQPDLDAVIRGEATAKALGYLPGGRNAGSPQRTPRVDLVLASVRATASLRPEARPVIRVQSRLGLRYDERTATLWVGEQPMIRCSGEVESAKVAEREATIALATTTLRSGEAYGFVVAITRAADPQSWTVQQAEQALDKAREYWQKADLPYGGIKVPDAGIQALIDSCIRNIYQAREIKDGLPAFQVGPTCYRGLWIVDGAFLLEAVTILDRAKETRAGVQYMLSQQRPDGSFELLNQHWKETGIVLWVIDRHQQLTGDQEWLKATWPRVEKAVSFIAALRKRASADPKALHAGLVPPGFPDGGLGGPISEYTNVYWLLTGLKSAVAMAERMGKADAAQRWAAEYDDMQAAFAKAAARDLCSDSFGNRMLPIPMDRPLKKAPHKALWAFLHGVYPGELFASSDPIMLGTMASLTDNECQGLVKGTGWLDAGIWGYGGSFYGHAFAWLGQGRKAAEVLYALGNHSSPLLAWREEQNPVGAAEEICGDMPHNWASAEFIRLTAHLLCIERGAELHLLEGLPPTWLAPGARTSLRSVLTRFGPLTMTLAMAQDGRTAVLEVAIPGRTPPTRVVLHTRDWANTVRLGGKTVKAGEDVALVAGDRLIRWDIEIRR
ncbi:MAG TPA: hypothetical protein PKY77_14060 [Phycisphaerae bacterium]|nr:hypothetical protein [Phycisphaerae bacterium]HRY67734.1 hypothetical protein [Phycisphaerae bacterium]HSA25186.1 hypothetical protein [Phycisphaerae bacterium]